MRKLFKTCLLASTLAAIGMVSVMPASAGEAQKGGGNGDVIRDRDRLQDGSCQDATASQALVSILRDPDFVPRQRQRQPDKVKEHTNKP